MTSITEAPGPLIGLFQDGAVQIIQADLRCSPETARVELRRRGLKYFGTRCAGCLAEEGELVSFCIGLPAGEGALVAYMTCPICTRRADDEGRDFVTVNLATVEPTFAETGAA